MGKLVLPKYLKGTIKGKMSHKCVVCSKEFDEKAQYLSHIKRCIGNTSHVRATRVQEDESETSSKGSTSTRDIDKLRRQYRELKEVAIKLKRVLEKYTFQIEDLTIERDTLMQELQDERDTLTDLEERLKKDYNKRFRIYKDYLYMKYAQHGVLPKNQIAIEELKTELKAKEEELSAFKSTLATVHAELKTLQREREFITKRMDDEAQLKLLKMEEEYQYQQKMEQRKHVTQITSLNRKINRLVAENQNLQKTIEKQTGTVNVAVSKAEQKLRDFFNTKLEAQRVMFNREIATRDKLLEEAGCTDFDLVRKMTDVTRGYEERIKKLKFDFSNKLNQIKRDTQGIQETE